jgi:hypothetical protein
MQQIGDYKIISINHRLGDIRFSTTHKYLDMIEFFFKNVNLFS